MENLCAEEQASLIAVTDEIKNQVISWGPKARWKIDLLLLPPEPPNVRKGVKSVTTTSGHLSSHHRSSAPRREADVDRAGRPSGNTGLSTSSMAEPNQLVLKEQLAHANRRIKFLEILGDRQEREMSEKLAEATLRAEKAAEEARELGRRLQRQEQELRARHEVERRLQERELQVLSRKFRALTGARRFAASATEGDGQRGDSGYDEESAAHARRQRDLEARLALEEKARVREVRALRRQLRASEARAAACEGELAEERRRVAMYAEYAERAQANAARHYHLAEQQLAMMLRSFSGCQPAEGASAGDGVPADNPWAAFGERRRVRSGLDDLAEVAEAQAGGRCPQRSETTEEYPDGMTPASICGTDQDGTVAWTRALGADRALSEDNDGIILAAASEGFLS